MPSETSAVNAAYIEARMKQFKLVDMREQYQELIRVASEQSMTYEDFLIMLLQAEETGKKRRQAERLTDAANFDSDKRLSDIDYRFNPNLDADKIQSLGRLEFMDNHENIIIIGPPGVGKSMIATGIGRNACEAGYKVLGHFILPDDCWLDNYYNPLLDSHKDFMEKFGDNEVARVIVERDIQEADFYKKYKDYYSYGFYIAQKL